jgi:hypothetical protein
MSGVREKIESILYAGLKPGGQRTASGDPPPASFFGAMRHRIDRWVSGGPGPSDPLYLTNRTTGQKARAWVVIGVPLLLVIALIGVSLSTLLEPPRSQQVRDLTPAEVAAKQLPDLKDLKIEGGSDIEIVELRVEGSGARMSGTLRNKTTRAIASADISCDLTDSGGTQLGGVIMHVEDIPASATKRFDYLLNKPNATFVLVRQIQTH